MLLYLILECIGKLLFSTLVSGIEKFKCYAYISLYGYIKMCAYGNIFYKLIFQVLLSEYAMDDKFIKLKILSGKKTIYKV